MSKERMDKGVAIVSTIDAQTATGTATADVVNMENFRDLLFIAETGSPGGSTAKLTFTFYEGTASAQTATLDSGSIGGGSLTNKQFRKFIAAEDLTEGNTHIKAVVKSENAATPYALVGLGGNARYAPASSSNLATVVDL